MNKIIPFLFLFFSCIKGGHFSKSLKISILNQTNKNLYWSIQTDIPQSDSIYINKKDSFEFTYTNTYYTPTHSILVYGYKRYYPKEINNMVYNLSDTTSLNWIRNPFYVSYDTNTHSTIINRLDSILFISTKSYETSEGKEKYYLYIKLIVTDSLLTLFQKDTSMLTKFKDYYNP